MKGRQRSFQPSMKRSMAAMRFLTEVKAPRRMACRVMIPKKISTRSSQDPNADRKVKLHSYRDPSVMHQRLCVLIRYWLAGVCGLILAR